MARLFAGAVMAFFLAGLAAANMAPPPPLPGLTADAFVQSLYAAKIEAEKMGPAFGAAQTDSLILADFTPDLLALYKQAIDIDEPIVDGDVFWNSQEYQVKTVAVKILMSDATSATVEASFDVMPGEARKVSLSLKRTTSGKGWLIDDITASDGSMRAWLAEGIKDAGK